MTKNNITCESRIGNIDFISGHKGKYDSAGSNGVPDVSYR